ncbi:abc1, partial [Symbiodinium necroappetens]
EQPRPSGALPEASPVEHSPGTDRAPSRTDSAATAGPRKLQLSSSQRRLLVLARLLLHRHTARLVLLDEPFAGMEQNEVTPLHSMLKIQLKHAALMTVTHRLLPVIHFFSRILVFHEGRCSE